MTLDIPTPGCAWHSERNPPAQEPSCHNLCTSQELLCGMYFELRCGWWREEYGKWNQGCMGITHAKACFPPTGTQAKSWDLLPIIIMRWRCHYIISKIIDFVLKHSYLSIQILFLFIYIFICSRKFFDYMLFILGRRQGWTMQVIASRNSFMIEILLFLLKFFIS